jgi:hypothetical protein
VKLTILVAAALLGAASTAYTQTRGRISVGGSVTVNLTPDGDVASATTGGPLVRLNPHRGWGPAGALNWFRADLQDPAGAGQTIARLRTRPLMAGVSYTIGPRMALTSLSIVAGPSFNRADLRGLHLASASIHAGDSFAVRPGVGVTITVAPRVAIVGFGGYLINRPAVRYHDGTGQEFTDRWKADAVVLSIGAVYSLF